MEYTRVSYNQRRKSLSIAVKPSIKSPIVFRHILDIPSLNGRDIICAESFRAVVIYVLGQLDEESVVGHEKLLSGICAVDKLDLGDIFLAGHIPLNHAGGIIAVKKKLLRLISCDYRVIAELGGVLFKKIGIIAD